MRNVNILNSKKMKVFHALLEKQFGFDEKLDGALLKSNKGRYYLITRDIVKLPIDELRIDNLGLYIATEQNDELRLSIEGSQLIGPKATKNILELSDGLFKLWIAGHDIEIKGEDGFKIIKNNDDFVGCGRLSNNILRNYIPKTRRITAEYL